MTPPAERDLLRELIHGTSQRRHSELGDARRRQIVATDASWFHALG